MLCGRHWTHLTVDERACGAKRRRDETLSVVAADSDSKKGLLDET